MRRSEAKPSAPPLRRCIERAERPLPLGARGLARGGRAARSPLLLHPSEPEPLSVAVVLGLVLRRDRLAAVRAAALARGAREPAERDAPRRLHRPRRLLGPAAEPRPADLLQRRLAAVGDDLDDPAAPARLGLAAGGRRSRLGAADRDPSRMAAGQPRPGRRRAAVAGAARRVGARLLAEVRPGLGPAAPRRSRLSAAGRAQPAARLGRTPDPRSRLAGALRGDDQRALVHGPGLGRGALDHPGDRRPALGRAQRPLPRRGAARRRPPQRLDLGGARPPGAARPAGADRPAPGRGAPARAGALLARAPAAVGLGGRTAASSPTSTPGACAATGAGRPGSTRPGCCGWAWPGSGTSQRRG